MHEFAHLRFGVYNEYASENSGRHVYTLPDGTYTGTRCSANLPGETTEPSSPPSHLAASTAHFSTHSSESPCRVKTPEPKFSKSSARNVASIFHFPKVVYSQGSLYNPYADRECMAVEGVPEADCRWVDSEGVSDLYASLMYRQYLDHVSRLSKSCAFGVGLKQMRNGSQVTGLHGNA